MKDPIETSIEVDLENQTIDALEDRDQRIIVSDCRSAISETLVPSEESSPRKKLSPEVATLTSESLSQIKEEIHRLKTTKIKKHKLSKDVLQIIEIIFSATQKNEMITIEEISTITGRPPEEIQKFLYQIRNSLTKSEVISITLGNETYNKFTRGYYIKIKPIKSISSSPQIPPPIISLNEKEREDLIILLEKAIADTNDESYLREILLEFKASTENNSATSIDLIIEAIKKSKQKGSSKISVIRKISNFAKTAPELYGFSIQKTQSTYQAIPCNNPETQKKIDEEKKDRSQKDQKFMNLQARVEYSIEKFSKSKRLKIETLAIFLKVLLQTQSTHIPISLREAAKICDTNINVINKFIQKVQNINKEHPSLLGYSIVRLNGGYTIEINDNYEKDDEKRENIYRENFLYMNDGKRKRERIREKNNSSNSQNLEDQNNQLLEEIAKLRLILRQRQQTVTSQREQIAELKKRIEELTFKLGPETELRAHISTQEKQIRQLLRTVKAQELKIESLQLTVQTQDLLIRTRKKITGIQQSPENPPSTNKNTTPRQIKGTESSIPDSKITTIPVIFRINKTGKNNEYEWIEAEDELQIVDIKNSGSTIKQRISTAWDITEESYDPYTQKGTVVVMINGIPSKITIIPRRFLTMEQD